MYRKKSEHDYESSMPLICATTLNLYFLPSYTAVDITTIRVHNAINMPMGI